eukprot:scaffold375702_cov37-Prasinocladus_malaysianus.AAC.1
MSGLQHSAISFASAHRQYHPAPQPRLQWTSCPGVRCRCTDYRSACAAESFRNPPECRAAAPAHR